MKKYTAIYTRLSNDDERQGESNSIQNQKSMLETYAHAHNLGNIKHYSDDGVSGTRWGEDRPSFFQLVEDVEKNEIDVVLVKDMSRVGRDLIRVSLFLEELAEKDIRLVAVAEGIDTANGTDDFTLPIKNMFNEFHSKDTSRKIKAVFQAKMNEGKRVSGAIPYGYRTNNGDINDLVIDEEASIVIRRAYNLVIQGYTAGEIVRIFEQEQVLTPSAYLAEKKLSTRSPMNKDGRYAWNSTTLLRTLRDPLNKGTLVLGKTRWEKKGAKRKLVKLPQSQWRQFEDRVPAIVDKDTWDKVQELLSKRRRVKKHEQKPRPLSTYLFCGACGSAMSMHTSRYKLKDGRGAESVSYQCSEYRIRGRQGCSTNTISDSDIEYIVLYKIRLLCGYLQRADNQILNELIKFAEQNKKTLVTATSSKVHTAKKKHAELDSLIASLYPNFAKGLVPEPVYKKLLEDYTTEQFQQTQMIAQLEQEVLALENKSLDLERFSALIDQELNLSELTTELVVSFLDKVVIHQRPERHSKIRNIDIHFKYLGDMPIDPAFELIAIFDGLSETKRQQLEMERQEARQRKQTAYINKLEYQRELNKKNKQGLQMTAKEQKDWEKLRETRNVQYEKKVQKRAERLAKEPEIKKETIDAIREAIKRGLPVSDDDRQRYADYKKRKATYARERNQRIRAEKEEQKSLEPPKLMLKDVKMKYKQGFKLTSEEQVMWERYREKRRGYNKQSYQKALQDPDKYKQYYGRDIPKSEQPTN